MTSQITFYLSQITGCKIYDVNGTHLGKVMDIIVNTNQPGPSHEEAFRPVIVGLKTKINGDIRYLNFEFIKIESKLRGFSFVCYQTDFLPDSIVDNCLPLVKNILDRQIVDINGRKLVRVNDIRLVSIASGTYAIAVDIGTEGLFRRMGVADLVNNVLSLVKLNLPTRYILWDDVEAFDSSNFNIKLAYSTNKLQRLHPSDLADIIEEMGSKSRTKVFESLDEEKAADVLEEMEPYAQAQIIESLSIGKAADVLEKMPADEVADLFDELEDETVELLLNEMEKESSEEVRELLEYEDKEVGSLMTTDYLSFREDMTIEEMGSLSRTKVFESLDEERAADVLEEMEPYAQAQIIESMSISKAADLLEMMPADEVADLMDELEDEKVELLLNEMEKESSEDVRELLEYDDKEVGSLMTTDYLSFRESMTIEDTLVELRLQKPEADMIYSLFITDMEEKLIATVSLRDLVISAPEQKLADIMNKQVISVQDEDKIDRLASIILKYDLLAIPVTDAQNTLVGMVVIDDIIEDLMDKGKTKKSSRSWR